MTRLEEIRSSGESSWRLTKSDCALDALKAVVSRRGFLRQQRSHSSLSLLQRWWYELQLLAAEKHHSQRRRRQRQQQGAKPEEASAVDPLDVALTTDRLCFDVHYASGDRVQDVQGHLLDRPSPKAAAISEILSYSTFRDGVARRITCLRTNAEPEAFEFTCSEYITDLQTKLDQALRSNESAQTAITTVIWPETPPPKHRDD